MRILHATRSIDPANGGPVEVIKQTSAALSALGHECAVVCLDRPSDPWVQDFTIPAHAVGKHTSTYGYSPRLVPWLETRAGRFDAILCHGLWGYHGRAVWGAMRSASTPYFVFPHGMLDPWFKRAHPFKHLKKAVYWKLIEQRVLEDARAVFFTCEEERELARQTFSPYRCREEIVTLGTAPPALLPEALGQGFLKSFPKLAGQRLLLFLGRIDPKKGCDLLLEAFLAAPAGMRLVIAGPCEDQAFLMKLKREAEGQPVTFLGMLTGDLKWGALAASEAFILPSHQENFGMAVAESLAMGTPVLISDQVNIWREIRADGAGLVAPDTLEGTRELLARWQSADREGMRLAATACFGRRFDIRATAEKIVALLQSHGQ